MKLEKLFGSNNRKQNSVSNQGDVKIWDDRKNDRPKPAWNSYNPTKVIIKLL